MAGARANSTTISSVRPASPEPSEASPSGSPNTRWTSSVTSAPGTSATGARNRPSGSATAPGQAIDVERSLDQARRELNPEHQEVVGLYVFEDLPAGEVAARVEGISEANVHKIAQRFRDSVSRLLPGHGDTSA